MGEYYVYQWVDLETGLPFYIGKGRGDRMTTMKNRSKQFLDYLAEHNNCTPEIICGDLSEDDAFDLERSCIDAYRRQGYPLVNIADGGRGGVHMYGSDNPMWGRAWYDADTPASRIDEWRRKIGRSGDQNPMWGVSPAERMDDETYHNWREAHKCITGDRNPNYGNKKLSRFYATHPDEAKAKQGRPGVANGRCKAVEVVYPDGSTARFGYIRECAEAIATMCGMSNITGLANQISSYAKSGEPFKGFLFKFV